MRGRGDASTHRALGEGLPAAPRPRVGLVVDFAEVAGEAGVARTLLRHHQGRSVAQSVLLSFWLPAPFRSLGFPELLAGRRRNRSLPLESKVAMQFDKT